MNTFSFKVTVKMAELDPEHDVRGYFDGIIQHAIEEGNFTGDTESELQEVVIETLEERSGPRMEIIHHDDHHKCIGMYDSEDPLFDIWPDGLITPMGAAPFDTTQMELAIAISKNFNFFYNSL